MADNYDQKTKKIIDSLTQVMNTTTDQRYKVDLLNRIAWEHRNIDLDKAKALADQAYKEAEDLNYIKAKATALSNMGKISEYQENLEDALSNYQISMDLSKEINDQKGIAVSLRNMGNIYYLVGKNEVAIELYKKSLLIRKKINDYNGMVKTYNIMISAYDNLDIQDSVLKYNLELINVYEQQKDDLGLGETYNEVGVKLYYLKRYSESLEYYNKSLEVFKRISYNEGIVKSYKNIGLIHSNQNNFNQALEYYNKVLDLEKQAENSYGIVSALTNIGMLHSDKGNVEEALKAHEEALTINQQLLDTLGMSDSYNNIGEIHYKNNDTEYALHFYNKALKLKELIYDTRGMANAYNNIGAIYLSQNKLLKAKDLQKKALALQEYLYDQQGKVFSLNALGSIALKENKFNEAKVYYKECESLALKYNYYSDLRDAYLGLSAVYASDNKFKTAYTYHNKFVLLKDSLLESQKSKELSELEAKMELERQEEQAEREKAIQQIKLEASEERQMYTLIGAVLTVFVLAIIIFLIQKQSQFRKESNAKLAERNEIIEEKNAKITSSINYAKRIQDAILPLEERLRIMPNSLVMYRPKDIVSGDFFWMSKRKNNLFFAVADCTGHGVPGAFMSMIGNTLFNEAVNDKGLTKTNEILEQVRDGIIKSLKQKGETGEQKDGMDASICRLDLKTNEIEFSGAHNPFYLVRDASKEKLKVDGEEPIVTDENKASLYEVRGDLQPIGFHKGELRPFSSNRMNLLKGDKVFLFSDGYPDQFGGKLGKKFKYSRLKTVLLRSHYLDLDAQSKEIESVFDKWKGDREQLDDVCLLGISIS